MPEQNGNVQDAEFEVQEEESPQPLARVEDAYQVPAPTPQPHIQLKLD